ncbi:MAG TPA: cation:dicarboxylase symporter family transporter, partial [Bacteroidia bacterium]|nr:cation:dicarboxylase symporter family transporter [Bacteroidia bacterium]
MLKKNILIVSILVAMIIGVTVGAFINSGYTSYFKEEKQKAQTVKFPEKEQKFLLKKIDKQEKQQKKDASSLFSLLSDIFLRLIKMIIAPLVFSVLVVGVAKIGDFKTVGRMGIKTLVYFTSATLIALILGLVIVNIFEPGKKMHLDMPEVGAESGIKANTQTAKNFI